MRFRRFTRQLHRWLGLLIGVQVLFWVSGGVVMSALRLEEVRGEHLAARQTPQVLNPDSPLVSPTELLLRYADAAPDSVTLTSLLGQPMYRLTGRQQTWLADAASGELRSPLPAAVAESIARADYGGDGTFVGIDRIDEASSEIRGHDLPLWRARFADTVNTTLYVSPDTGLVVARRNDLWRAFDFVWMLHIMDYDERENVNNTLLRIFTWGAVLMALSGAWLLLYAFPKKKKKAAPR